MQFGIFYEHQLPKPWTDGDEHQLFQDALDQIELADRLGIDYVWEVEHHFLEEYSHSSAPEVFLAACSQRTTQIRLGHGIVLMPAQYNHPARVAERIATLDLISNGRVEWGTGKSSSRIELEGFGIDPEQREEMWLEAVEETAKMLCATPYPGHDGHSFSMPQRNVVPKSLQRPHPPLWVACSNRDTIRQAARLGMGALCFAFVDGDEAKEWVDEYYRIFKNECRPIGQAVNPNLAIVSGFMCHEDSEQAVALGLEGFQFFGYALSHYYIHGTHRPGEFDLWADFQQNRPTRRAPTGCIGNPAEIRKTLMAYEEAGVDQVILLQQAGNSQQEHICRSLELFAKEILPEFDERHIIRQERKEAELAPYIEKALQFKPKIKQAESRSVASYPVMQATLQNGMTAEEAAAAEQAVGQAAEEMISSIAGERI